MDRLRWEERRVDAVVEHLVKEGIAWVDEQSTDTVYYWIPSLFLQQYGQISGSNSGSDSLASAAVS